MNKSKKAVREYLGNGYYDMQEPSSQCRVVIDRAGNCWRNHVYFNGKKTQKEWRGHIDTVRAEMME